MKGFDGIVSLNGQSRDASFVEGYDFLMRGTTIKDLMAMAWVSLK
jgi:hypothetical protein